MGLGQLRLDAGSGRHPKDKGSVLEDQGRNAVDIPLLAETEVAGDRVIAGGLIRLIA
ncbi:hypothetical protein OKW34_003299 [Paraburkholderia youngii]|uniref:hypothetical protein n=1 Tax=Paraburkholderia youngii TaxID=2782701 RepID=UPI003D20EB33